MTITTKYDIGQEVFFVDHHCAGITPGKGRVVKITFQQDNSGPLLVYWVKADGWPDPERYSEVHLFASLSEFKDTMIQRVEEACEEFGKAEVYD